MSKKPKHTPYKQPSYGLAPALWLFITFVIAIVILWYWNDYKNGPPAIPFGDPELIPPPLKTVTDTGEDDTKPGNVVTVDKEPTPTPEPTQADSLKDLEIVFDADDFTKLRNEIGRFCTAVGIKSSDIKITLYKNNTNKIIPITRKVIIVTEKEIVKEVGAKDEDQSSNSGGGAGDDLGGEETQNNNEGGGSTDTPDDGESNAGGEEKTSTEVSLEQEETTKFEQVEKFIDVFTYISEHNPGLGAGEPFLVGLPRTQNLSDLKLVVQVSAPFEPSTNVWSFKTVATASSNPTETPSLVKLTVGTDWGFELVEFKQTNLLTFGYLDDTSKTYVEFNGGEPTGGLIKNVQSLLLTNNNLTDKKLNRNYCDYRNSYINATGEVRPPELWMPVITGTTANTGTVFSANMQGHDQIKRLIKKESGDGTLVAEFQKTTREEDIDKGLQVAVLKSRDYLTDEPIEDIAIRLRYMMDGNREVVGFAIERNSQKQVQYFPITISQAEEMRKANGIIRFHPRAVDARIDIVDVINKRKVQNVEFLTDENTFNDNNVLAMTIPAEKVQPNILPKGYVFRIDFADPPANIEDWKRGEFWIKASGFKDVKIKASDVGRQGKSVPEFSMLPVPRNIVILIPQTAAFKKQFDETWKEGEFNSTPTNGSLDEVRGIKLYAWGGDKGALGLIPRFVETLKNTLHQKLDGLQGPLSSTEIEVYVFSSQGIEKYEKRMDIAWHGTSVDWSAMLSGGGDPAVYKEFSHRFGPRTTVIALIGGVEANSTDTFYNPENAKINSMQIVLFAHEHHPFYEGDINFAKNNSDTHYVVSDPTIVKSLTLRASEISEDIINEYLKEEKQQ